MAAKIKKGDKVVVLAGKDKGKQGEITAVFPKENKAVVDGVNIAIRHQRQTQTAQGGRVAKAMPIDLSNLSLMDKNGNNLGDKVAFEAFNRQLTPVNRHLGSKLVGASQSVIHGLIQQAEAVAAPRLEQIVADARATMLQTLGNELARLSALKAVNPTVRDSELDHLRELQQELGHLLDQTQLKLDSLRFIVVAHG